MKSYLFALLLAAGGMTSLLAEDWVEVYRDSGSAMILDKDSVTSKGDGTVRVWTRILFNAPEPSPFDGANTLMWKFRISCDCSNNTWSLLESYYYKDRSGYKLVDSSKPREGSMPFKTPKSGSAVESLLKYICKTRNSK